MATPFRVFLSLVFCFAFLPYAVPQVPSETDANQALANSAVAALVPFGMLTGQVAELKTLRAAWQKANGTTDTVSTATIERCAARAGLTASATRWSLEAIRERGGIAILYLRQPEEFVLLIAQNAEEALVMRGGDEAFLPYAELAKRYTGACLVPASAFTSEVKNPLVIRQPLMRISATNADVVLRGEIALENRGKQPITVKITSQTCSCYGEQPALSSPVIAPGGSTVLTVPVRSRAEGTESATVVLSTTDPSFPQDVVNVRVASAEVVSSLPKQIHISTREGVAWSGELTLNLPRGARIKRMYARNDHVRLKASPALDKFSDSRRITLTCPPDATPGIVTDAIVFELSGAAIPNFTVPVTGIVQPDITANPPQLFLGEVKKGVTLTRKITLESAGKRPFEVWSVTTDSPDISVVVLQKGKSVSKDIEVTIRVRSDGVFQQDIKLMAGYWRKITIPVTAMAPEKTPTTVP